MATYLQDYGAGDQRRELVVKWATFALLLASVTAVIIYFQMRDRAEVERVERFLEQLGAGDYRGAYATWGCTETTPCTQYSFEAFLEDWGPQSSHAKAAEATLGKKKSCENGVIQFVRFPGTEETPLWLERGEENIGFSPWTVCNPNLKAP